MIRLIHDAFTGALRRVHCSIPWPDLSILSTSYLARKAAIKTGSILLTLVCQVNDFRMTGAEQERMKIIHALKECSQEWKEARGAISRSDANKGTACKLLN